MHHREELKDVRRVGGHVVGNDANVDAGVGDRHSQGFVVDAALTQEKIFVCLQKICQKQTELFSLLTLSAVFK